MKSSDGFDSKERGRYINITEKHIKIIYQVVVVWIMDTIQDPLLSPQA